jgi:hypothetical protein
LNAPKSNWTSAEPAAYNWGIVYEFAKTLARIEESQIALADRSVSGSGLYTVQEYLDYSHLGCIAPHYLPKHFSEAWIPNVLVSALQPLDAPIAASVESGLPRQMWPRNAWKQLKYAIQSYSCFDDDIPLGTNEVLQLASEYVSLATGSIFVSSFTSAVSVVGAFGLMQPFIKKLRRLLSNVLKASTLYGGKAFLVSAFQTINAETAAHDHTLHIESIALALARSTIESIKADEHRLDSGSANACKRFLSMSWKEFCRPTSATLSVCSSAAPIGNI